jgi:hypothetical protein
MLSVIITTKIVLIDDFLLYLRYNLNGITQCKCHNGSHKPINSDAGYKLQKPVQVNCVQSLRYNNLWYQSESLNNCRHKLSFLLFLL